LSATQAGHPSGVTDTATRTAHTFRGPGGAGLPNLVGLPGVLRLDTALPVVVETERFDTRDRRLAAAGITLELYRAQSTPAQWQLQLPDETLRMPAGDSPQPEVPGELRELVRAAARERPLRPVGQIRTVRTENRLLGPDDRHLATLVHNEVTVATMGRRADVRGWTEIDLRPGDEHADYVDGVLDGVAARVTETGMQPGASGPAAELDRMLRPLPRQRAGRRGSAGAVLMDYIGRQVDRIAAEELRVRRDQPDAVHQMRVASRRLRSALKAYRDVLDRKRTDPIADGLRDLGRRLAPARDAEVLRESIDADLAAFPSELLLGPARAEATRHFARVESEARAAVLAALDSPEHRALRNDLDDLLERPPLNRRARRPAGKTLDARRTARRLRRAMNAALDGGDDAALHTARKAAKRLRYAQEVTGTRNRGLKALQKALGEHQDVVVARPVLRELGASAENGFSFGLLWARADDRAAAIEADLPALWRRARTKLG
jgi:CHAD domain-containing protein